MVKYTLFLKIYRTNVTEELQLRMKSGEPHEYSLNKNTLFIRGAKERETNDNRVPGLTLLSKLRETFF